MKTIKEAKLFLQKGIAKPGGCKCPACGQEVKLQKRKISTGMVEFLLKLAFISQAIKTLNNPKAAKSVHYKDCNPKSNDYTTLAHWGLIEAESSMRGHWRITALGLAFLQGKETIKVYSLFYDGQVRGFAGDALAVEDFFGEDWTLQQAIGKVK